MLWLWGPHRQGLRGPEFQARSVSVLQSPPVHLISQVFPVDRGLVPSQGTVCVCVCVVLGLLPLDDASRVGESDYPSSVWIQKAYCVRPDHEEHSDCFKSVDYYIHTNTHTMQIHTQLNTHAQLKYTNKRWIHPDR